MSGWDVSSTPTWGPQDGPDETQSFASAGDGARDFGSQEFASQDFGRPAPSSPAGGFPESQDSPPPEFFAPEYGQQEQHDVTPGGYPRRTPGRSLQGLPRREASEARGRHSSAQPGSYGRDDAFSQEGPFGQGGGYGRDSAFGQDGAFGQDRPFSQDPAYGQDSAYGQDAAHGQDPAYNQDSAYGIGWGGNGQAQSPAGTGRDGAAPDDDGGWGRTTARGAAPWEEQRPQQDPFYPDLDSSAAVGGQDYPRQAPGRPATADHDWGRQDDQARDGARAGTDYASPDYLSQDYPSQDYASQDYPGQADHDQQPAGFDRRGEEQAARMDPALQDFFAPQGGANGYQDPWGDAQGGSGGGRNGVRYRQGDDGWAEPDRPQAPRVTGPRPAAGGGFDDEPRRLGTRSYIAIGAVVAVIIVVAFLALSRGGSTGSSPAAAGNPTTSTTSAASSAPPSAKASASASSAGSASSGGAAAAAAYVLSTPSKAGGFPKGSDPHFLSIATSTAAEVSSAVTEGKAGAVKGSAISAAYQLPVAGQVVTFVGYQGTFTPAKVATVLASLGTDAHSYPAGAHGGVLGCANTKATASVTSGAVCVWASSSTIGVTEFFSATGPEALTASQNKGATDTVNIRGDVEAKSS